jgi:cytochrome P450
MVDMLVRRQARNPESGLDVSALRNEAATIFMAGHETTATALTWAFYLLANAPWVESELVDEVKSVCGERAPILADVPQLNWCRAVVEEALRLYPPVPFLARQAKAKDVICGIEVEPASLVIVSPWLLHRAPQLWDRPNDFVPERFLGARPGKYVYLPFSAGPRVCAGQAFGLAEAILCVASLAQKFVIRPIPGRKVEPVCRLSLRPRDGLPVTVMQR